MNADAKFRLGVIVPVGSGDTSWQGLDAALRGLPEDTEILFSAAEPEPRDFARHIQLAKLTARWLNGPAGRGGQINRGITATAGTWIWILHADCRPEPEAVAQASKRIQSNEPGMYYFDLAFANDGPALTKLNAWGANLRSSLFGLPFGDQGFLVHHSVLEQLGGFDENLNLGEDLDFAVRARAAGCPPRRLPGSVSTSARRYREHGWLATTAQHAWLTIVLWIRARRRTRKHST